MKKILLPIVMMTLIINMCGCSGIYTVPVDLMKVPKIKDEYVKNEVELTDSELRVLVQSFVPDGYKILETNKNLEKKDIYSLDVDGDGSNEYVVLVRNSNKMTIGFIVLKNKYGVWSKVYERLDECIGISTVKVVSGFYQNDVLLIVGNMLDSTNKINEYHLFNFKNSWDIDPMNLGVWSNVDVINGGDGYINFMCDYIMESRIIDLFSVKYDGDEFKFYNNALGFQLKSNQYKKELDNNNTNESLWYYYIYSLYMSGDYDAAIDSLDFYKDRDKSNDKQITNMKKFELLKANIMIDKNRVKEAKKILSNFSYILEHGDIIYMDDIYLFYLYYVMGRAEKAEGNYELATKYFNKSIENVYRTFNDETKLHVVMTRKILESMIRGDMKYEG